MPSELLTDKRIKAIKPPASGRLEIWDTSERGLILRVSSAGTKTWCFQFKTEEYDGKGERRTRRVTLGEYGDPKADPLRFHSLADARRWAVDCKAAINRGEDPAQAKVEDREMAKAEGVKRNVVTLKEAIDAFAEPDAKSASKWKAYERPRILKRELADHYGARGVGEIAPEMLKKRQVAINKRPAPILANRFAEATRAFYNWAVGEYGIENPASALKRVTDEDDFRRDRFLTVAELRTVWRACDHLSATSRDFVRALMLTPQRVSAVSNMRFRQIGESGVWTIPRRQKKQKVSDQALPLSDRALEIIHARKGEDEKALVFCTGRKGDVPLGAISKIKATIDKHLSEDFEAWRFHDFRRSFATWAAGAGIDQAVTRKILDHGQGRADKLDAIYNRHSFLDEQRTALNAYAEAVCPPKP